MIFRFKKHRPDRRASAAKASPEVKEFAAFPPGGGLGEADIQKALDENRVTLLLQPQFELESGRICGVETLARLWSEKGELIYPADFLPRAEESGLIRPLGRRLFQLACEAAERLARSGWPELRVAINLSAIQLTDAEEVGVLIGLLMKSAVEPHRIEIELTESIAIECFECAHAQLQRFRALGVSIALDDFGTGFNSFSHLLDFEIDRFKIDRRFISAIERSDKSKLTASLIDLGRTLSLDVVAEGVETQAEADWLRRHRCPSVQGFLFARPLSLDSLLALLEREAAPFRTTLALTQEERGVASLAGGWPAFALQGI